MQPKQKSALVIYSHHCSTIWAFKHLGATSAGKSQLLPSGCNALAAAAPHDSSAAKVKPLADESLTQLERKDKGHSMVDKSGEKRQKTVRQPKARLIDVEALLVKMLRKA